MTKPIEDEYPVSEVERAAARMKSYTGSAVLVFFLYALFFLPGLIVNYIYYQESKRIAQIAGHNLPGQGCLAFMLWWNVGVIILASLAAIGLAIASL